MKVFIEILDAIEKAKKTTLPMFLIYLVFHGCFGFPVIWTNSSDKFTANKLLIYSLVIICIMFTALYKNKILHIFCIYFIGNAVGMFLRFLLEYGEVSNERNFTIINIIIFLIIIPILTALGSVIINKVIYLWENKIRT